MSELVSVLTGCLRWELSILGGRQGKRSPKRNIKIEGDPQDSSVPGSKALGSFKNEDKDSSIKSSNEVFKNTADKYSLDLALWVVPAWGREVDARCQ